MTFHTETQNTVRTRWNSLVEVNLRIPTIYPNTLSVPPSPGSIDYWAQYDMVETDAAQGDIGADNPLYRHVGFVNINLYFKLGGTAKSPNELLDSIIPLFRSVTVTTPSGFVIVFRTPRVTRIGEYREW